MNSSKDLFNNIKKDNNLTEDMINEIEEAKQDWIIAQKKLDYVTEKDQIDYAIFALEAAEKRYEMLIREAKKMNLNLTEDKKIMEE